VSSGPTARLLADGRRLHLQHGPIDLIIEAWGAADEVAAAYRQATEAFQPVLTDLVDELPTLRRPMDEAPRVVGPVARRMVAACGRHPGVFVTPMAAVAGAVADHVLSAMIEGRHLERAYVNNGGDIALHITPGHALAAGLVTRLDRPAIDATVTIDAALPVRGLATSGQGGRSLSFGIGDAVTVLAADAAAADVAATLIANAVTIDAPTIRRAPAASIDIDSDLGDRLVVVEVGPLGGEEIEAALAAGATVAKRMQEAGLILGAFLTLKTRYSVVGPPTMPRPTPLPKQ
jgi:Uncharacterized conserved protein